MDKILLSGLEFWGYHGALPEEQVLGQMFVVDLELGGSFKDAACQDDLSQAINYAEVYQTVKAIMEGRPYKLIEALAENIADTLLTEFLPLQEVKVRVNKPHAPIPGIVRNVAVEIKRSKVR